MSERRGARPTCYLRAPPDTLRQLEPALGVSAGTLDSLPSYSVCLASCTTPADCAPGYVCALPLADVISVVPGATNDRTFCITVQGCESCDAQATCQVNYDGNGTNRCACNSGYVGDGNVCTLS